MNIVIPAVVLASSFINAGVSKSSKKLEALDFFSEINEQFNFFPHDIERYVFTSHGFIWSSSGHSGGSGSVLCLNI
jgi:hypothetical protein